MSWKSAKSLLGQKQGLLLTPQKRQALSHWFMGAALFFALAFETSVQAEAPDNYIFDDECVGYALEKQWIARQLNAQGQPAEVYKNNAQGQQALLKSNGNLPYFNWQAMKTAVAQSIDKIYTDMQPVEFFGYQPGFFNGALYDYLEQCKRDGLCRFNFFEPERREHQDWFCPSHVLDRARHERRLSLEKLILKCTDNTLGPDLLLYRESDGWEACQYVIGEDGRINTAVMNEIDLLHGLITFKDQKLASYAQKKDYQDLFFLFGKIQEQFFLGSKDVAQKNATNLKVKAQFDVFDILGNCDARVQTKPFGAGLDDLQKSALQRYKTYCLGQETGMYSDFQYYGTQPPAWEDLPPYQPFLNQSPLTPVEKFYLSEQQIANISQMNFTNPNADLSGTHLQEESRNPTYQRQNARQQVVNTLEREKAWILPKMLKETFVLALDDAFRSTLTELLGSLSGHQLSSIKAYREQDFLAYAIRELLSLINQSSRPEREKRLIRRYFTPEFLKESPTIETDESKKRRAMVELVVKKFYKAWTTNKVSIEPLSKLQDAKFLDTIKQGADAINQKCQSWRNSVDIEGFLRYQNNMLPSSQERAKWSDASKKEEELLADIYQLFAQNTEFNKLLLSEKFMGALSFTDPLRTILESNREPFEICIREGAFFFKFDPAAFNSHANRVPVGMPTGLEYRMTYTPGIIVNSQMIEAAKKDLLKLAVGQVMDVLLSQSIDPAKLADMEEYLKKSVRTQTKVYFDWLLINPDPRLAAQLCYLTVGLCNDARTRQLFTKLVLFGQLGAAAALITGVGAPIAVFLEGFIIVGSVVNGALILTEIKALNEKARQVRQAGLTGGFDPWEAMLLAKGISAETRQQYLWLALEGVLFVATDIKVLMRMKADLSRTLSYASKTKYMTKSIVDGEVVHLELTVAEVAQRRMAYMDKMLRHSNGSNPLIKYLRDKDVVELLKYRGTVADDDFWNLMAEFQKGLPQSSELIERILTLPKNLKLSPEDLTKLRQSLQQLTGTQLMDELLKQRFPDVFKGPKQPGLISRATGAIWRPIGEAIDKNRRLYRIKVATLSHMYHMGRGLIPFHKFFAEALDHGLKTKLADGASILSRADVEGYLKKLDQWEAQLSRWDEMQRAIRERQAKPSLWQQAKARFTSKPASRQVSYEIIDDSGKFTKPAGVDDIADEVFETGRIRVVLKHQRHKTQRIREYLATKNFDEATSKYLGELLDGPLLDLQQLQRLLSKLDEAIENLKKAVVRQEDGRYTTRLVSHNAEGLTNIDPEVLMGVKQVLEYANIRRGVFDKWLVDIFYDGPAKTWGVKHHNITFDEVVDDFPNLLEWSVYNRLRERSIVHTDIDVLRRMEVDTDSALQRSGTIDTPSTKSRHVEQFLLMRDRYFNYFQKRLGHYVKLGTGRERAMTLAKEDTILYKTTDLQCRTQNSFYRENSNRLFVKMGKFIGGASTFSSFVWKKRHEERNLNLLLLLFNDMAFSVYGSELRAKAFASDGRALGAKGLLDYLSGRWVGGFEWLMMKFLFGSTGTSGEEDYLNQYVVNYQSQFIAGDQDQQHQALLESVFGNTEELAYAQQYFLEQTGSSMGEFLQKNPKLTEDLMAKLDELRPLFQKSHDIYQERVLPLSKEIERLQLSKIQQQGYWDLEQVDDELQALMDRRQAAMDELNNLYANEMGQEDANGNLRFPYKGDPSEISLDWKNLGSSSYQYAYDGRTLVLSDDLKQIAQGGVDRVIMSVSEGMYRERREQAEIDLPDGGDPARDRYIFFLYWDALRTPVNLAIDWGIYKSLCHLNHSPMKVGVGALAGYMLWRFGLEKPIQYDAREATGTDPK